MRNLLSVPALMEESAPGYRGEARGRTGTAPRNHPDYRSMARPLRANIGETLFVP